MPRRLSDLLAHLSDRPEVDKLARFLHALLEQRGDELAFVVLFGSMARGDWSLGSDYDVLIGLRTDDGKRFIDRMGEFAALAEGDIEVFPYSHAEWQHMWRIRHPLLLEALEDGLVLWDTGAFAAMREKFRRLRASGASQHWRTGWKLDDTAEP